MLLELLKIAYGALLISVYCFWRYAVIPPLVWAVFELEYAVVVYGFVLWLVVKTWASKHDRSNTFAKVRKSSRIGLVRRVVQAGRRWLGGVWPICQQPMSMIAPARRGRWKAARKVTTK